MSHLVLCSDCGRMRPAAEMLDMERGYVCAPCRGEAPIDRWRKERLDNRG